MLYHFLNKIVIVVMLIVFLYSQTMFNPKLKLQYITSPYLFSADICPDMYLMVMLLMVSSLLLEKPSSSAETFGF